MLSRCESSRKDSDALVGRVDCPQTAKGVFQSPGPLVNIFSVQYYRSGICPQHETGCK